MLRQLSSTAGRNLLAGSNPADDAAVYRLTDEVALVQTVDFFTPVVDDPYLFGRIAAANSLSDVYAVGGVPLTALNIACFPVKTLPLDILAEILRGGADMAREAEVAIVGGHTVDDEEPKYGLSVIGTVHPDRFFQPAGAKRGDVLVLTKPIGTGLISTALKAGRVNEADIERAIEWMTRLNRDAAEAMKAARAHAATDITGFGLLGHLVQLCQASELAARVSRTAVPLLPGAIDYARAGGAPSGTFTNLSYVESSVDWDGTPQEWKLLLADPQTSGGLLVALPPDGLATFQSAATNQMLTAVIGEITTGRAGEVQVTE